jgi:PAS domain S-box-containing protein
MTHPALATPEIQAQLIAEALGGATVGILVWDEDGRYIAANDAACSILGTTLEDLLGQRVGAHTHDGEALIEQALRGEPAAGEATVDRFDGSGTIAVRYLTFTTRTAGMPFMATIIWR